MISGDSVRRSTTYEHGEDRDARDDAHPVAGLPQPHRADCCRPNTLSPTPADDQDQAAVVHRRRTVLVAGLEMAMSTRAMSATGILIQKMARQVHWIR